MRRAAAALGGGVVAVSPWRLRELDHADSRAALEEALAAPRVLVTSPAAARYAAALRALPEARCEWFAVGAGTAEALHALGVRQVEAPRRMDSEGLLALPGLQHLHGSRVGLVTAPGGRGTLVPALTARGAHVLRANVYQRVPVPMRRALSRLRGIDAPTVLAVSSGEALQALAAALAPDIGHRLRTGALVAASDRLVDLAATLGFSHCRRAASARPDDLVGAAHAALERPSLD